MVGTTRAGEERRPLGRGYRMPAEWEPHRATWLVWPHNRADFEVKTGAVEWCYTEIVRHLVGGERVALVVQDARVERRARARLRRASVDLARVEWHRIATDRAWIRDAGPIFVVRPSARRAPLAVTDWHFNGWARYRAWRRDDALPARIARRLGVPRVPIMHDGRRFVLEGEASTSTGTGCCSPPSSACSARSRPGTPGCHGSRWRPSSAAGWGSAACCGWGTGSPVTTPTGTWTTSRGSSTPGPWWWPTRQTGRTRTTRPCERTAPG